MSNSDRLQPFTNGKGAAANLAERSGLRAKKEAAILRRRPESREETPKEGISGRSYRCDQDGCALQQLQGASAGFVKFVLKTFPPCPPQLSCIAGSLLRPYSQIGFFLCCSAKAVAKSMGDQPKPRHRIRKERLMASIKTLTQKITAWRRYREAVRELSQLNDHELSDIGLHRCDIETAARQPAKA